MNRILLTFIFCYSIFNSTIAQVPEVGLNWVQSVRGAASSTYQAMVTDENGYVYTCGDYWGQQRFDQGIWNYTLDGISDHDAFVAKYDDQGTLIWARVFGGLRNDYATGIAVDPAGNVYISGWRTNEVDFNPDPIAEHKVAGPNTGFLLKINSSGIFQWVSSFNRSGSHSVKVVYQDNGQLLVGAAGRIFKYDTDGKLVTSINTGQDEIYSLSLTNENEILIGGSNTQSWQRPASMYFMKIDSAGTTSWLNDFTGSNFMKVSDIASNPLGDVLVTGIFDSDLDFDPSAAEVKLSPSNPSIFIARYSKTGSLKWAKKIEGTQGVQASSITFGPQGQIFFTGSFYNSILLQTKHGVKNFQAAGGNYDSFLLELDSLGNTEWVASIGGPGNDYVQEVNLSADSRFLYWTGSLNGEFNFDLQGAVYSLKPLGQFDAFVAQYEIDRFMNVETQSSVEAVKIFPNPSSGLVHMELKDAIYNTYSIRALDGKLLRGGAMNSSSMEIDTQLNPGVYLLELTNGQHERSVHRLVIQ